MLISAGHTRTVVIQNTDYNCDASSSGATILADPIVTTVPYPWSYSYGNDPTSLITNSNRLRFTATYQAQTIHDFWASTYMSYPYTLQGAFRLKFVLSVDDGDNSTDNWWCGIVLLERDTTAPFDYKIVRYGVGATGTTRAYRAYFSTGQSSDQIRNESIGTTMYLYIDRTAGGIFTLKHGTVDNYDTATQQWTGGNAFPNSMRLYFAINTISNPSVDPKINLHSIDYINTGGTICTGTPLHLDTISHENSNNIGWTTQKKGGIKYNKAGLKLHVVDSNSDIREYSLTQNYNLSTATLAFQNALNAGVTSMYYAETGRRIFYLYSNSIVAYKDNTSSPPFGVSVLSGNTTISTGVAGETWNSIYLSNSGKYMFLIGHVTANPQSIFIRRYNASTPWNFPTFTPALSLSLTESVTKASGLWIAEDGKNMLVGLDANIRHYTMSTPWDVTTASAVGTYAIPNAEGPSVSGIQYDEFYGYLTLSYDASQNLGTKNTTVTP